MDGRADIYALGCVLFESLTGMAPFTGDIHSMITSHLTKPPPRLSQTRPRPAPGHRRGHRQGHGQRAGRPLPDRPRVRGKAARRALLTSGLPPPVVPMPPPPPGPPTVSAPMATPPPPARPVPAPAPAANLLTPAPPGVEPPPPGPGGTSGGRSRLPLVLGGAAVIVALIIGGVLVLGGGDDGGGGSSDDESTTTTIDQEAAAQDAADEAFGALPPALAAACDLGDVEENDRGVVANISCEPSQGAEEVQVIVFEDEDDVDEAFAEAESAAGEELATDGDCETACYAVHSWATADDPDGVAGQVACYLDDSGNAGLAWTDANGSWTAVAGPTRRGRRALRVVGRSGRPRGPRGHRGLPEPGRGPAVDPRPHRPPRTPASGPNFGPRKRRRCSARRPRERPASSTTSTRTPRGRRPSTSPCSPRPGWTGTQGTERVSVRGDPDRRERDDGPGVLRAPARRRRVHCVDEPAPRGSVRGHHRPGCHRGPVLGLVDDRRAYLRAGRRGLSRGDRPRPRRSAARAAGS